MREKLLEKCLAGASEAAGTNQVLVFVSAARPRFLIVRFDNCRHVFVIVPIREETEEKKMLTQQGMSLRNERWKGMSPVTHRAVA